MVNYNCIYIYIYIYTPNDYCSVGHVFFSPSPPAGDAAVNFAIGTGGVASSVGILDVEL